MTTSTAEYKSGNQHTYVRGSPFIVCIFLWLILNFESMIAGMWGFLLIILSKAILRCKFIAWGNFLKRCISEEWGHLILKNYKTLHTNTQYESRHWFQITLITGLWKIYSSLWKHRITTLHDPTHITYLSNIECNTKVWIYVTNCNTVLGIEDQYRYMQGLQTKLNFSVAQKQNWIITIAHQVKSHMKDKNTLLEQVPTLHTYCT